MAPAQPKQPDGLSALVERCRSLTVRTLALSGKLPPESEEPFLYGQLQDTLQQLDVIIRVVQGEFDEDDDDEAPGLPDLDRNNGLFRRLKKALSRRSRRGGHTPQLFVPHQGLQGNSWTIPIPDLVGFLASARKTGVLWVHAPKENFLIELRDGCLLHATSNRTPEGDSLDELLLEFGHVSKEALEEHLCEHGDEPETLGGSLEAAGVITRTQLVETLSVQVQHLFHRLLGTENALFRFQEGVQLMIEQHIQLNITQLLLESARVHDEAEQLAEIELEGELDEDDAQEQLDVEVELEFDEDFQQQAPIDRSA